MKYAANILTGIRIAAAGLILAFPSFSLGFYIAYLVGGFTDMVDGTVARKTNTASEFGAKLDSIADVLFAAACLVKLLPALELRLWIWIWVIGIALIKVINIIAGFVLQKQLVMLHTAANKGTGFLLFLFPLLAGFADTTIAAVPVCAAAAFAAVQEGYLIFKNRYF